MAASSTPIKSVSFTAPTDYSADLQEIARRRKLAEMLQAQSMKEPEGGGMVGNIYVKSSPFQGLARMLHGYAGTKTEEDAKKAETELISKRNKALVEMLSNVPQARTELQAPVDDEGILVPQAPKTTQPTIRDYAAYLARLSTIDPSAVKIGGSILSMQDKGEKFGHTPQIEMIDGVPNAVLYGDKGTRKVIGPISPRDKFNTQTADNAATLTQAKQHWEGLSAYQQQQIAMEAERLGISVQQLILDRARAANQGLETRFNTGQGVVPGMPAVPRIPQVPQPRGAVPQPLPQSQPAPQIQPSPVQAPTTQPRPQPPPQPLASPQNNVAPSSPIADRRLIIDQVTPKERQKLLISQPQEMAAATTSIQNMERLVNIAKELHDHPGLSGITGKVNQYSLLDITPETRAARGLQETMIKQIAIQAINAMRAASKTGAAVGNVTEKEWPILEQSVAALSSEQPTGDYRKGIENLIDQTTASIERVKKAYEQTYGPLDYKSVPHTRQGGNSTTPPVPRGFKLD